MVQEADGSEAPVTLVADGVANDLVAASLTGRFVVYVGTDHDLWYVGIDDGDPITFRQTSDLERQPSLSPDGRFVSFGRFSNTGAFLGNFVERFPEGGGLQTIRSDRNNAPIWSADGRQLLFAYTQLTSQGLCP